MAEHDDLGAQLDALKREAAALRAPGLMQEKLNPGAGDVYRNQQASYLQRIADLQKRYEASLGNPGAVTGRGLGPTGLTMNAPGVPALRFDASSGKPPLVANIPNLDTPAATPSGAATGGALPPVRRPRPPPVAPAVGALQSVQTPSPPAPTADTTGGAEQDAAINPASVASVAAPVAPPQKGLREQYMERLAGMAAAPAQTGMTQEQKGMALMEAGLAIMAAASKPGASALGSIGEGAMRGTATAREMEKLNRELSDKRRAENRANIGTEFTLAGQDEDRADRQHDRAETRRIREEDLKERGAARKDRNASENRRIDLLEKQVEQGESVVQKSGGRWVSIKVNTQKATVITDADGRPISSRSEDQEDPIVKRIKAIAGLTGRDVKDVANTMIKDQSSEAADELDTGKILRRFPAAYLGKGENDPKELPARLDALAQAMDPARRGDGKAAQAAAVREQYRQGKITKDQAVKELQKLGYQ